MTSKAGAVLISIVLASCGGSASEADAPTGTDPDGPPGSDAGVVDAAASDAPACPDFVSATPEWHDDFVSDANLPRYVAGRVFRGTDSTGDILLAVYDPALVQTGVDFDPVFETAPAHLELYYDVNADLSPQMAFATIAGALNLTSACPDGVAGTITDGVFAQVTLGADDLASERVPGGCTVAVPSLAFSIGAACP